MTVSRRRRHVARVLASLVATVLAAGLVAPPAVAAPGGPGPADPPISAGAPEAAHAEAAETGQTRVIAHLDLDAVPEGLLSAGAAAGQRAAIASGRASVAADLGGDAEVTAALERLPAVGLEVSARGLRALESHHLVAAIEVDEPLAPALDVTVPHVDAAVPAGGTDGSGTVVAVLDTGVDGTHVALEDRVVAEACFSSGRDGSAGSGDCPDGSAQQTGEGAGVPLPDEVRGYDHGTHVAAIAATAGPYPGDGMAPGAGIMAVQVFHDDGGRTLAWTSDILLGLEHVAEQAAAGLDVVAANLSLGGGAFTGTCSHSGFAAAAADLASEGVATIAAAGNAGRTDAVSLPACVEGVISVGATTISGDWLDGRDGVDPEGGAEIASYSNVASFVDLVAPGNVRAAIPDNRLQGKAGTSMAAPHVAGAWARLRAATAADVADSVLLDVLQETAADARDTRDGGQVEPYPELRLAAAVDELLTRTGEATELSGTVRARASGEPVADVAVTLTAPEQTEPTHTATTDADGAYRFVEGEGDALEGTFELGIDDADIDDAFVDLSRTTTLTSSLRKTVDLGLHSAYDPHGQRHHATVQAAVDGAERAGDGPEVWLSSTTFTETTVLDRTGLTIAPAPGVGSAELRLPEGEPGPVIDLTGEGVTLEGLRVVVDGGATDSVGVRVAADGARLSGLELTGEAEESTGLLVSAASGAVADVAVDATRLEGPTVGVHLDATAGAISGVRLVDTDVTGAPLESSATGALDPNEAGDAARRGISLDGDVDDLEILRSVVTDSSVGVELGSGVDGAAVRVADSEFVGNDIGLRHDGTGQVDATDNWWGSEDGPRGSAEGGTLTLQGSGDAVEGDVAVDPWRKAPTAEVVASLAVTPPTAEAEVGDDVAFTATATYVDASTAEVTGDADWTSSDPSVASVAAGVVTAEGTGEATISAIYDSGGEEAEDTATLTVTAPEPEDGGGGGGGGGTSPAPAPEPEPEPEPDPEPDDPEPDDPEPEPEPEPESEPEPLFDDVPEDSAHRSAIEELSSEGIITGFGDGSFRPFQDVSRAETASLLDRAFDITAGETPAAFGDVPEDSAHTEAIERLASAAVIAGFGDGSFRPFQPVTRAEAASLLDRVLGDSVEVGEVVDGRFGDVPTSSAHAAAVDRMAAAGVITGFGDGSFRPFQPISRAEMASLLSRARDLPD